MTTPQDTEQYIHRAAVDAEGNRIGKITKVYLDDQTGQPLWVLVETGLFGTRQSFAPIHGSRVDGELVVLAVSKDQVKDAALNLMRFFEDESCGQCTPCRVGTQKAATLMEQRVWNRDLLDELSQAMRDASICGLGQAASNPLTTVIKYFPNEFAPKEAAE